MGKENGKEWLKSVGVNVNYLTFKFSIKKSQRSIRTWDLTRKGCKIIFLIIVLEIDNCVVNACYYIEAYLWLDAQLGYGRL